MVIGKSAFRGTGTQDVALFVEGQIKRAGPDDAARGWKGFNLFNHGELSSGRAQTIYGDTAHGEPDVRSVRQPCGTATNAMPALANIDPPRMFQFQVRFIF